MDIVLCREFTPSLWSKRFPNREQVLKHHLQHIESESKKSLFNLSHTLNISYGEGEREKIDIFGTDLPSDSPFIVFIHGGFWHELSREQSCYFACPLHSIKFKTIIIGYDLCPHVKLETIIFQIEKSIKFIFEYVKKFTPRGIYLIGHSAGAHLAAKVLSNRTMFDSIENIDLLKGVFLVSGIYNLIDLIKTHENTFLNLSLNDAVRLSPQYNCFSHLLGRNMLIYMIVAENDSNIFIQQSRQFYEQLSKYFKTKECISFDIGKGMDHFDIMETLSNNNNYLTEILLNIA